MALIQEEIEVRLSYRNLTYWRDKLGNADLKYGEVVKVSPTCLPQSSKQKVKVQCDNCGKLGHITYSKIVLNQERNNGSYHCKSCSTIRREQTMLEKYGVENAAQVEEVQERKKETVMEKYGVNQVLQSKEVRDKIKQTVLEKYGTTEPLKSEEIRKKCTQTILQKYGVTHYSKSNEYLKKVRQTWLDQQKDILKKYGAPSDIKVCKEDEEKFVIPCIKCDKDYEITLQQYYQRTQIYKTEPCTLCNPIKKGWSSAEKELTDFVKSLGIDAIENDKDLLGNGQELDIYCPSRKVAIEYNGFPWHCEPYKDKWYHYKKTKLCLDKGVRLIHIWADEWSYGNENDRALVKSNIKSALNVNNDLTKIGARSCQIKMIAAKEAREFLTLHHSDGYANSKIKLGLFHKDELVQVMTFSKPRLGLRGKSDDVSTQWELVRMASKQGVLVQGGASKLFKHFLKQYKPEKVVSYCHRYNRSGTVYDRIGMRLVKTTPPGYFYVKNKDRYNRFNFRKDKLVSMLWGEENETEKEIMQRHGYHRLWDCGQQKWVWEK